MTDLISRNALLEAINSGEGNFTDALIQIEHAPAIVPQVVINVTGGVADVVAADYPVDVNVLDYDITDNEQSDYVIDEDGDQAWLYGERANVDADRVREILSYPTVGDEAEVECQNCDWSGKEEDTKPIKDLHQRVAPGEKMPAGECPSAGVLRDD